MGYEIKGRVISLKAQSAVAIADKYKAVYVVATNTFALATAGTELVVGVVQTEAKAGEAAAIMIDGVTMYKCTGNVIAGAKIGNWGVALEAGAANDIIAVQITPLAGGAAPTISTASLASAVISVPITPIQLACSAGTLPLVWSIAENSTDDLPVGIVLSDAGVLSGTPTEAKTYSLKFQVTNPVGTDTETLSWVVSAT